MRKRSFVELPVDIDVGTLLGEVDGLAAAAWQPTWWGSPHCSVSLVLLRGGTTGTPADVLCDEVEDQPVLRQLPAIAALIGASGPFGGCRYAFLFRMAPGGVALAHTDGAAVWHRLHRVHVPLRTHPSSVLVVEGRCHHLAAGRAWTFDNQALHGFSNGPVERVHLILDVEPSARFRALLEAATVNPGVVDPVAAGRTLERERAVPSYPGDAAIAAWREASIAAGWADADLVAALDAQGVPSRAPGAPWSQAALDAAVSGAAGARRAPG